MSDLFTFRYEELAPDESMSQRTQPLSINSISMTTAMTSPSQM